MKTIFTFLLLTITLLGYSDGGDGFGTKCYVFEMDITYNLFYTSIDGELTVINTKGKEDVYEVTSNIAIYDIAKNEIKYLFTDSLNEKITNFYFETFYDSLNKQIRFNRNDGAFYGMDNLVGNYSLNSRQISEKLIVITYSYTTKMYSLWLAHKNGTKLKRVHTYSANTEYFIDVKNKAIRFVTQKNKLVEIKDVNY